MHKQYSIATFSAIILWLVGPRLGLLFFRDDFRAQDSRRFQVASHSFVDCIGECYYLLKYLIYGKEQM